MKMFKLAENCLLKFYVTYFKHNKLFYETNIKVTILQINLYM